jgi:phosphoglycerol transferase MdoB-like AlkP superfamily enzyme
MRYRLRFFVFYVLFWLLLIVIGKLLFLFYHHTQSFELKFSDWLGVFIHGAKLDFSAIGYILIFPVIILIVTSFLSGKTIYYILNVYTIILICFFAILTVIDLELYRHWGYRLDKTPLFYINTPGDMLASVYWYTIVLGLASILVIVLGSVFLYLKYVAVFIKNPQPGKLKSAGLFVLILVFLIIPIRGSFDTSPVNLSTAYFHENHFANHAAVNILWNFGNSLTIKASKTYQFDYLEKDQIDNIIADLYKQDSVTNHILNLSNPNIILIILESYTAKLIQPLGGIEGITPNFNKLTGEGIFFENFYANDSRSDKGIVSILSGYPALGIVSIIKFPKKTQSLPYISKHLSEIGYHNSFYYGGDINFANINSYLFNGDFDKIISKSDFEKPEILSSWGVPDHIIFNRLYNDIKKEKGPFFKVFFTLSNHEPFDIPVPPVIEGNDTESKMFNSSLYTDSCIGDFVKKLKLTDLWDKTLIIFLADHGHILPGKTAVYGFRKYHIPMLWLGGALKRDTIINKYGSQTDLARTLLNQLGVHADEFSYSKDLLSESSKSFAFYDYNNGFGFLTDSVRYIYDNDSKKVILKEGYLDDMTLNQGRALQQLFYMDYYSR